MKKRKQLKLYKKQVSKLLAFYKEKINFLLKTPNYKELTKDMECITKLIQQNKIKELNIILNNFPFICYVEDLINWYLYDFYDNNKNVYDINLRK